MDERTGNYVVVYESNGNRYKLCRVFFGADGSYYVTCPYHIAGEQALLFKGTVNYALQTQDIAFEDVLDLAAFDDERNGIKLSHHPDGFVQFSGPGIESGRDENGEPRGLGIMSWTFDRPASGPSFGVTVFGFDGFKVEARERPGDIVFTEAEVEPLDDPFTIAVEGYYLPALWRRFVVRDAVGRSLIRIAHPTGAILELRVAYPSGDSAQKGFLGLEVYALPKDLPDPNHGFAISSSTGNLRKNSEGHRLGDSINCVVPRGPIKAGRRLDYVPPSG